MFLKIINNSNSLKKEKIKTKEKLIIIDKNKLFLYFSFEDFSTNLYPQKINNKLKIITDISMLLLIFNNFRETPIATTIKKTKIVLEKP